MLLVSVAVIFLVMLLLSMPIVFSLAVAGIAGLWMGGYPMQQLPSALVSGSAELGATGHSGLRVLRAG